MNTFTLPEGSTLYHGTELEYDPADVEGPLWLSNDLTVAKFFARGGRILNFVLSERIELPLVRTRAELEALAREYNIDLFSAEEIRESVLASDLPGWTVTDNYGPGAHDILLRDTQILVPQENLAS